MSKIVGNGHRRPAELGVTTPDGGASLLRKVRQGGGTSRFSPSGVVQAAGTLNCASTARGGGSGHSSRAAYLLTIVSTLAPCRHSPPPSTATAIPRHVNPSFPSRYSPGVRSASPFATYVSGLAISREILLLGASSVLSRPSRGAWCTVFSHRLDDQARLGEDRCVVRPAGPHHHCPQEVEGFLDVHVRLDDLVP